MNTTLLVKCRKKKDRFNPVFFIRDCIARQGGSRIWTNRSRNSFSKFVQKVKNILTLLWYYYIIILEGGRDMKKILCTDGIRRTEAQYEEWLENLQELAELEPDDLTDEEIEALQNEGLWY